jgi:hypothetical protein
MDPGLRRDDGYECGSVMGRVTRAEIPGVIPAQAGIRFGCYPQGTMDPGFRRDENKTSSAQASQCTHAFLPMNPDATSL